MRYLAFLCIIIALSSVLHADSYEPNNNFTTATWIEVNNTWLSGTIDTAADQDWFKFNTTVGSKYLIKTRNLGSSADTTIRIYSTDGSTLVGYNDDVSMEADLSSSVMFLPTSSGTFYAVVRDYSASASGGTYQVGVLRMGRLIPALIEPTGNISVNRTNVFNVSANVTCIGGPCYNITATLDPIEDKIERERMEKSDKEISEKIKNRGYADVIVQLKETETGSMERKGKEKNAKQLKETSEIIASELESTTDFIKKYTYENYPGFSGRTDEEGLKKLLNDPRVERVYYDYPVHATMSSSGPLIRANDTWARTVNGTSINGSGQTVCVADTGINYNHADFAGGVYVGGYDFINLDSNPMDDHGHGSHVAGTIASGDATYHGVAPGARIAAVKVLNSAGSGSTSAIIAGIDWCTTNAATYNISVISMSLGYLGTRHTMPCENDAMASSIRNAIAANISVVIAAGNDGYGGSGSAPGISTPACIPGVISVGATDKSTGTTVYYNRALMVSALAPGYNIVSTAYSAGHTSMSGTSMATPHISGVVALVKQAFSLAYNRSPTPSEIKNIIRYFGVPVTDSGGTGLTYRRVDAYAATGSKGIVPMNSGLPFFTTSQNPSALFNLEENATQNFTWQVNASAYEGTYRFFAVFEDNSTDYNVTSDIYVTIMDTLSPSINISSPANRTYNTTSIQVSIAASDSNLDRTWFWNGTANETYTGAVTRTFTQGSNIVYVYANDTFGNNATANVTFVVDTNTPNISFVSPLNTTYLNASVLVNISANDSVSGINGTWFWNGTANVTYVSAVYANFSEGNHTIIAYANDSAGNLASVNATFTIDTQNPNLAINSPANRTYTNQTVLVNITASDSGSGLSRVWFYNGSENVTYVSAVYANFSEGNHTIIAYANDSVGNNATANVTFTIDTVAPNITIVSPVNNTIYTNATILVNLSSSDNTSGISSTWFWNGTANVTYVSAVYANFSEGNHTIIAYANDSAGNLASVNATFTIDTQNPNLAINSPANRTYTNQTVLVNITASDSGSGLSRVWFYNGSENVTYVSAVYANFSEGNHTIIAYANDSVGNNATANVTFTVDSVAPNISIVSPTSITYTNTTILVNLSVNDSTSGVSSIRFWNGTANETYTSPVNRTFSEGNNTVYAYANDSAGNNQSANVTFVVDARPPSITIISPANRTYTTSQILINISATDVASSVNQIWYQNGSVNTTYAAALYGIFSEGNNTLLVWANDSNGNRNNTEVNFSVDTLAPTFNPENQTILYGSALAVQFSATDASGISNWSVNDTTRFRINGSGYLTNISQLSVGGYFLNVSVNDTLNQTTSRTVLINVTMGATINSCSVVLASIVNGTNVSLRLNVQNATNVWADIVHPGGGNGSANITNNANVTYTNTSLIGRYNVTFHANGSLAYIANCSSSFEAFAPTTLNITIVNSSSSGLNSTLRIYRLDQLLSDTSSTSGSISLQIINSDVDLDFRAYGERLQTILRGVNLTNENNKTFGMSHPTATSGYLSTYSVNNNYTFSNATISIGYDDVNYTNESILRLHKCANWNFTTSLCTGTWTDVTNSSYQNLTGNLFVYNTSSFSGFSIHDGYCGDLVCQSDESCSSCSVDCGTCSVSGTTGGSSGGGGGSSGGGGGGGGAAGGGGGGSASAKKTISLEHITLSGPTCTNDKDCQFDSTCFGGSCRLLRGVCGYPVNHTWKHYDCCTDDMCPNAYSCKDHSCLQAGITTSAECENCTTTMNTSTIAGANEEDQSCIYGICGVAALKQTFGDQGSVLIVVIGSIIVVLILIWMVLSMKNIQQTTQGICSKSQISNTTKATENEVQMMTKTQKSKKEKARKKEDTTDTSSIQEDK